ncbi:hypothetical protein [Marinoscillum pacificum]|uniref:hypothetical protein n=1 Tax=Marinoscillum pacificum TaxID=392723 RepID=UPI0021578C96|nr:hypothetical protein [Marinoscillum pacificum]
MKLKFITNFGMLIFLMSTFHIIRLFDFSYESEHPSLNEYSTEPDIHLNNVRHYYTKEADHNRSMYHLDQAIQSIKYLETDVDLNTSQIVDEAIEKLKYIYEEIKNDTLVNEDLNHAFEFALTSLSLAELRVSERYAESNKLELSRIALKYSKLHLKHALEYSFNDSASHYEKHVYEQIDSLLANFEDAPVFITEKIDLMIDEMDSLLQLERNQLTNLSIN